MAIKSEMELAKDNFDRSKKLMDADKSRLIHSTALSGSGFLLDLGCVAFTLVTKNFYGIMPMFLATPVAFMSSIETLDNLQFYKKSKIEYRSAEEKLKELPKSFGTEIQKPL